MQGAGLEPDDARADLGGRWSGPRDEGSEATETIGASAAHDVPRGDLILALARQLAWAHGQDPDAQPYPLRSPHWRSYYTRAKTLLSISPAEHRAMAAVLGREPLQRALPDGTAPHA